MMAPSFGAIGKAIVPTPQQMQNAALLQSASLESKNEMRQNSFSNVNLES